MERGTWRDEVIPSSDERRKEIQRSIVRMLEAMTRQGPGAASWLAESDPPAEPHRE
jgi:hypothetical protein